MGRGGRGGVEVTQCGADRSLLHLGGLVIGEVGVGVVVTQSDAEGLVLGGGDVVVTQCGADRLLLHLRDL